MIRFTPGPWKSSPRGAYVSRANGVNIAAVLGNTSPDERRGNAHVIAAAPGMYEAVQSIWELAQNVSEMSREQALDALIEIQQLAGAALPREAP